MLRIYDQNKNPLGYIIKYKDLCVESDLSTGDGALSFTYFARSSKDIRNEYYVETKDTRYVVKEAGESTDGFPTFKCQLDLEDLEADMHETFSAVNKTLEEAALAALAGTGWRVDTDITKLRSVATLRATPLTILGKIRDAWMCEIRYDTKNKIVYFRERFGEDKGVYFTSGLNLRKAELTNDSYDYYTRIIPIGKNGLRIGRVNDSKDYLENYQYSNKVRTLIWEDTSYEDAAALKEDAERKLDDLSKPKKSYSADVIDLAAQNEKYSILSYGLGDTVLLLDERSGLKDKQRIVKMKIYPQTPEKNSCELSNTTLSFEEYQARIEAAAAAFENISNKDGTVNGYYVHCTDEDGTVSVEVLVDGVRQDAGSAKQDAAAAKEEAVAANTLATEVSGKFGKLEASALTATEADLKYATIKELEVEKERVHDLEGDYANFKTGEFAELKSGYAEFKKTTTDTLAANSAEIGSIKGDLADYKTVVAGQINAAAGEIDKIKGDLADYKKVVTQDFTAANGRIDDLEVKTAEIDTVKGDFAEYKKVVAQDFTATTGRIDTLSGDLAAYKTTVTGDLTAINTTITNLTAKDAELGQAIIGKADIKDLDAVRTRTGALEADVADITTLVNGNLTSDNIQSLTLTSKNTTIENGMIKSAMIYSLAADKITGLDINTTKLTVHSDDGKSTWTDNTIQISDANRVRVQIGEDASGDYNLYLWDAAGKLMWNATGATADGLNDGIIKDVAVAADANISGSKLDIESVIREVNGAETALKATKIKLDEQNQTLDVAFKSLKTYAEGVNSRTESNTTAIGVAQGQISTLISNTTVIKDGKTVQLKDAYNSTVADIGSIKTTLGQHTSTINEQTGKIEAVTSKANTIETDLNGTKQTVSAVQTDLTGTKSRVSTVETGLDGLKTRVAATETAISKKADNTVVSTLTSRVATCETTLDGFETSLASTNKTVSDNYTNLKKYTDSAVAGIEIGGRNYLLKSKNLLGFTVENSTYCSGAFSDNTCTLSRGSEKSGTRYGIYYTLTLEAGKVYTFSFEVTAVSGNDWTYSVGKQGSVWGGLVNHTRITSVGKKSLTFTAPSDGWVRLYISASITGYPITLKNAKLESGNRATDWTPAPEDTDAAIATHTEQISSHETRIAANEKGITLKVSSSDFNSYKSTVTTDIGTAKQAAITAAANDATTKANNALASAKTYTNGQITTVNTHLTTVDSSINTLKDQIKLKVEQKDIETAVANIEVGGRNLLLNSSFSANLDKWTNNGYSITTKDGYKCAHVSGAKGVSRTLYQSILDKIGMDEVGQEYTISADVRLDNYVAGTTNPFVGLYFGGSYNNNGTSTWLGATLVSGVLNDSSIVPHNNKGWVHVVGVIKFTKKPTTMSIHVYARDFTGDLYVKNYKMEKGNRATDWSPAPEDIDSKFTNYSTTAEMQSEIKLSKQSIEQTVSKTYATKTELKTASDKIGTLENWKHDLTTQTLTQSGITSLVGSYYSTKEYADSIKATADKALNRPDKSNLITVGPTRLMNNSFSHMYSGGADNDGVPCIKGSASDQYLMFCEYTENIFNVGDIVYFNGVVPNWSSQISATLRIWFYNENKTCLGTFAGSTFTLKGGSWNECSGTVTVTSASFLNTAKYFIVGLQKSSTNASIGLKTGSYAEKLGGYAQTIAEQTESKFAWLVKSGTSATNFELTDRTATLVAIKINLSGLVQFSGLDSTARGKITTAQDTADTAKANAATAQSTANTAKSTADSALGYVTVKDTRNDNQAPQWYMQNHGYKIVREFKQCSKIGLSVSATYCTLETKVPWKDSSGGYPTQVATIGGGAECKVYKRIGTSNTAWGAWVSADQVIADWCYSNNKTYINGGKIYTGTIAAAQIAANAITTDKLNANAVTAAKLATDAIKSRNYAYSSGNYSTAGTFLDLSNGVIRSKNFGIDASGNAYFKGSITATSGTIGGFSIGSDKLQCDGAEIVSGVFSGYIHFEGSPGYSRAETTLKAAGLYLAGNGKLESVGISETQENESGIADRVYGRKSVLSLGYTLSTNDYNTITLDGRTGSLSLSGSLSSGTISEGGTLLSDKYANKTAFTQLNSTVSTLSTTVNQLNTDITGAVAWGTNLSVDAYSLEKRAGIATLCLFAHNYTLPATWSASVIGTVPAGFGPTRPIYFTVAVTESAAMTLRVTIETNGKISMQLLSGKVGDKTGYFGFNVSYPVA